MQFFDLVIIGGGIAGLSAAIGAKESGINSILILEREQELGGNLNQGIHSGFGLDIFDENLTGTEFSQKLIDKIIELKIEYKLNTTVIELNRDKTLTAVNSKDRVFKLTWKALVVAAGCMESAKNVINIAGSKFAGIYTAGAAQKMINIEGYLPGKEAVVVGSDDLGLIMARRMIIEGARVKAVIEKSNSPKGSKKNVKECVEDFNIPLLLNHEVIKVNGNARVEELIIASVDSYGGAIAGTEKKLSCDTVLLSVKLLPQVELLKNAGVKISKEGLYTDTQGIFVCGDANYIHKDADSIVLEGREAGVSAYKYISGKTEF